MSIFDKIESFYAQFKGEKGVIGYSLLKKPIYYFKVEKTKNPVVIIQYSIHAREHVTSFLALKQIKDFIKNGRVGSVYFLPMTNPDGVFIALNEKPLYKANGRGVDLNVNFDARWGLGEKNVKIQGDENFIGEKPFSEPESLALKEFTLKIKPSATISYHSKGEEIYWEFHQRGKRRMRDEMLANALAKTTGYKIKSTPNSCGGYKDWCVEKLKIPALTIEVGSDELLHPLGKECVKEIYEKNKRVVNCITEFLTNGKKIYEMRNKASAKSTNL
ncbi:MAG: hypothetical protein E7347_01620 [Clostridiales bacterium]|nr:hypothetical protein [Clostridiales bacterium]